MSKTGRQGLLTPKDSVLLLIDHQPFQFANLSQPRTDDDRQQRDRSREDCNGIRRTDHPDHRGRGTWRQSISELTR
jgi:hypothetical protein